MTSASRRRAKHRVRPCFLDNEEAEIDQLVYSPYGLTGEEVAIIEESLQEKTTSGEVTDEAELEE
ncbi:MAG: hypothetical protein HY695_28145 [Deltaproteobacteria bacterium]|nr:hypothetical protein [Deltaproteobacteria bacterium]